MEIIESTCSMLRHLPFDVSFEITTYCELLPSRAACDFDKQNSGEGRRKSQQTKLDTLFLALMLISFGLWWCIVCVVTNVIFGSSCDWLSSIIAQMTRCAILKEIIVKTLFDFIFGGFFSFFLKTWEIVQVLCFKILWEVWFKIKSSKNLLNKFKNLTSKVITELMNSPHRSKFQIPI